MKKGLSLLTAIILLLNIFPAVSFAENDELLISTAEEFTSFITQVNNGDDFTDKTAVLGNDIELTTAITPIKNFNGEFNGAGHTLSDIQILSSDTVCFNALFETMNGYVHDLTIEGTVTGTYAAAIAETNNGVIERVHSIANVQGKIMAGGICVVNEGTIKSSTANGNVIISTDGSSMGGICAHGGERIENCECKASLIEDSAISASIPGECGTDTTTYTGSTGGIIGYNQGDVINCVNYSDITGEEYIGGIAGENLKNITGCINTGDITAKKTDAGGISGRNRADAAISDCKNSGRIKCGAEPSAAEAKYYTGGIAGENSGSISECENGGGVLSAERGAGGIAGACAAGEISLSKNLGEVKAYKYFGGIAGEVNSGASVSECTNFGDVCVYEEYFSNSNFAGGIAGVLNGTITDCFNASENIRSQWNCGSLAGFAGGDELVSNSNSIGSQKLIGNNKTAVNSANDAAYEDNTAKHASTLDELNALLDSGASVIALDSDIDGDITISRKVTLDGQYHSVGNITQNAAATIKDIFVNGEISSSADLTLEGVVSIANAKTAGITAAGDVMVNGALDFDSITIPLIKADGTVTGAELLFQGDDGYYFSCEPKAVTTVSLVVKKDKNTGLSYDIYPYITGASCYFFMPYSADLTQITYTKVTSVGDDITEEDTTIDLSADKTAAIEMPGTILTASAMVSGLPVLYLDIDEDYGSIYTMNNSPKHSDKCYGDMRLEVPEEMAAVKGWNTIYESAENDANKAGTIELRGRGNSSWSQALKDNGPRPYQMKLEKKLNIMGMGSAKTYVLLKSDQIQSHNKTLLDMSIAMGLKSTPQSEFVDVYLNGDYIGMYTLAEKVQINKERINISDLEDEIDAANGDISGIDTTGGYLVEIDNTLEDLQFTAQGNRLTIKSPENLGTSIDDENYTYIKDLMTDLFDAVYGDGYLTKGNYKGKHFTEVLDMDSVTRYFLEQELTSNRDNSLGSTFFYKDKDSIDGKIYMDVVWDNDRCGGTDTIEGWWLPKIVGYNKQDGFFNAMCQHKEFISYVLAYYNDNVNDNKIKEIFKEYANVADANGAYIDTAAQMSRIRWNHKWPFTPTKLGGFIRSRAAWVDENIDTIAEFATKGKYIEVTDTPVETPDPNPAVQPEDEHIVAGFRYGNGTAGTDLDASLGDKTNGYKATVGEQKDTALLLASVNGENTKTLEWSKDIYADGEGSYTPAVVSASTKNMWDKPYADITMSTIGYDRLYLSAKLGATKKGPASYKLQYSLDGTTYTDIENTAYTLTDNKDMQQAFKNVKLPSELYGKDSVHIRITAAGDLAVNGLPLSDNPSGGEFAFNDIFICDVSGNDVDTEYSIDTDKINISVRNNTASAISADIYTAVYNGGALEKVFKTTQDIAAGSEFKTSETYAANDNETVRIFCWKKDTIIPYN